MDFRRGHRVTKVFRKRSQGHGEFRRSQIVTPVAAECIARRGVTTPCYLATLAQVQHSRYL